MVKGGGDVAFHNTHTAMSSLGTSAREKEGQKDRQSEIAEDLDTACTFILMTKREREGVNSCNNNGYFQTPTLKSCKRFTRS